MIKIDPTRHVLLTNHRKSMIGLAAKGDWNRYPQMMMFCGYKGIPIETRYMSEVKNLGELHIVISGIKEYMREQHMTIADQEKKRRELLDTIKELESLNVLDSMRSASYFMDRYKKECKLIEDGYSIYTSFKDLCVKENTVLIPDRVEPFYINTDDDLLPFNIGDVVEICYPNNPRYKGITVRYVVNNFLEYEFGHKTKRLALTPLKDNWGKSNIVIIDDAHRFECLMIDLYPCNRRPFYGWYKKTVSIKKVNKVEKLPRYHGGMDLEKLLNVTDDTYILVYGYGQTEVTGVKKGHQFYGEKIITKKDVQAGVKFLKSSIDKIDKYISDINENICDNEGMLTAISEHGYENLFTRVRDPGIPIISI